MPTAAAPDTPSATAGVGPLLRDWRNRRRRSQLDLALDAGVSPRHLSFIETGRARPSAALLVQLAEHLAVPLRERNRLLLAAGHAPRYAERPLDDAGLQQVRQALDRLLAAHDPCPGLVLDRQWQVVQANASARQLMALLPDYLATPPLNVFRASLHPQGMAAFTENFDDWGRYLLQTLQRAVAITGDPALRALQQEVLAYPNVQALQARPAPESTGETPLLVPCVLRLPQGDRLSMFTTLTTFGTPRDITLDELCVELFYPADAATDRLLRGG